MCPVGDFELIRAVRSLENDVTGDKYVAGDVESLLRQESADANIVAQGIQGQWFTVMRLNEAIGIRTARQHNLAAIRGRAFQLTHVGVFGGQSEICSWLRGVVVPMPTAPTGEG